MSFRLFVWWCTLCGGWAALAGWAAGRLIGGDDPLGSAGLKGQCLGALVALGLGIVDALWVFSLWQLGRFVPRVLICVVIGAVGGLVGGVVGQWLFERMNGRPAMLVLGWGLTGVMVGVSIGAFDFLRGWVRREELRGTRRKLVRGVLGGALGGVLGGFLYLQVRDRWAQLFPDRTELWSPSAIGFVALGLCIGLAIGVAQVVLQEAWVKVESGFRKGRELLVARTPMTIGRAESCDLGLFGDNGIERMHARILRLGGQYVIEDAGSGTGTFVNDIRIEAATPLRSGDLIGVGKARLRFVARETGSPYAPRAAATSRGA
jgi:hypothetical protein